MTRNDTFLAAAAALLGPRGLTCDPDLLAPWLTDWRGRYTGSAMGLASPADSAELAKLVMLAGEHNVTLVPQGGNSGMSGGATPDASGASLLVSLRRMNAIGPIDLENRRVTCGAGVVLQNLHEAAEAVGLRFPLTLGGKGSATVGGLISTNAGGTQVLRHGNMRSQVLGLEAVLADGAIYSALTPLKKDNRGFDLKQLFIGSEGTLGIVTAATLKLEPALADRRVIWAGVESIQAARALLLHAEKAVGEALEGFEVIPHPSLEAVFDYAPDMRSPLEGAHAWYALIEVVADAADAPTLGERVETMLADAFEAGLLQDAAIANSESQAEAFWGLRETVPMAERSKGPAMQHDISVPVEKMPDFITDAIGRVEATFPGVHAVAFGHLGDGNVHFHVISPEGSERAVWEASDGKAISRFVHDLVTQWGGSLSAEHGIGQMKVGELQRLGDPASLGLMRAVKSALDPKGLLNPGKLLPSV
ncbi:MULTISPECIES: FAD-binding oxidoreductase [unclassified Novosphingobium]|uniref:FAD-binding oxidoreductase n=1 Tax=unclassified Novosphingobium TaxID=2644732 RepID=UPI00086ECCB4|nr:MULTISPECIES: FAD-binding oxidoreductase [unclassified Novosphingobium]MBN9144197.1 FAD-binding oxidoreductase [Novosphingobium sp.]MDR6708470.1 FAD/FMN-containing dehydrogenase [Novosphingobium sp. 1748]ODU81180.1 MAG: hydroxyacid dehydrogenase [Novosphingobium sp. SCN 63-17]OJX94990.1 MAG: hydroxyacid dehydrogenase [Novosphingobium sp. 63-713]